MKLVLPDACWKPDLVSGAAFLYFCDGGIGFTLHPSVSTFMTGADPFEFIRLVEGRHPAWITSFSQFTKYWRVYRGSLQDTATLLEPLRGGAFKTVLLSYPRGGSAWESAEALLSSSALPLASVAQLIDPYSASDELFAHIFFEKYLELYFPDHDAQDFFATGLAAAGTTPRPASGQTDWSALYDYCATLFGGREFEQLLSIAYMFRMPLLQQTDAVLLSNERLIPFLESLPVAGQVGSRGVADFDVAAWEFFRQLVSPLLDPLTSSKVQSLANLLRKKPVEIRKLKVRCLHLAEDLGQEPDLGVLQTRIRSHIRANVRQEVQDVLDLDTQAVDDLLTSVFADEKTWLGISGLLYSLLNGGPLLTAGAAIYALSSVGSKAFKAAAHQKKRLHASDYALLYRMKTL